MPWIYHTFCLLLIWGFCFWGLESWQICYLWLRGNEIWVSNWVCLQINILREYLLIPTKKVIVDANLPPHFPLSKWYANLSVDPYRQDQDRPKTGIPLTITPCLEYLFVFSYDIISSFLKIFICLKPSCTFWVFILQFLDDFFFSVCKTCS